MMDSPWSMSEIRETTEKLIDESDRSLKVRPGEKLRSYLPALDARKGKILAFDKDGDPIVMDPATGGGGGGGGADFDLMAALEAQADEARAAIHAVSTDEVAMTAQEKADALANGVNLFTDLRARKPRFEGERVFLRAHTAAANAIFRPEGSGWFRGHLTAQADDGGYVASSGQAWHWEREKPIAALTIADFGGVADGVTDAQPAFKANLEFLMSPYARLRTGGVQSGNKVNGGFSPALPIRFGSGRYYVTPGEYNKYGDAVWNDDQRVLNPSGFQAYSGIRIEGVPCVSGEMLLTEIISDKSDAPVFLVNHRRMNVSFIQWNGQQTTKMDVYNAKDNPSAKNLLVGTVEGVDAYNKYASNKQPFMKNECPGGCFVKIYCFSAQKTGDYTFYVLDTLDTIIDRIRASDIAGPFFQSGWSDPQAKYYGAWDHSTSIEVKNINIVGNACPALWMPRVHQGVMHNIWISGPSYCAYDINNGQWLLSMICIENSFRNPIHWNSRDTLTTLSVPTGNDIDINSPTSGQWYSYPKNPDGSDITAWANAYDQGRFRLENFGAYFDCPMVVQWDRGIIRGVNNTDNTLWVNIGELKNPSNGGEWKIRVIGHRFYGTSAQQDVVSDSSPGEAVIFLGRSTNLTPQTSWHSNGSGPLAQAPQYQPLTWIDTFPAVWVPIKPRCAEFTIFVEGTGLTRKEAGVPAQFKPGNQTQITNPNLTPVQSRFTLHNGKAGFGALDDVAAIKTASSASPNSTRSVVATDTQFLDEPVHPNIVRWERMNINGQILAMPVYAWKPVFTTNNPATLTVAAGGTLTLAPVVTDAQSQRWQKSTDGGTTWTNISGATAQTYTKANVTADDAGQYRLQVSANNGSGSSGITTNGPVTTVTVS